MKRFVALALVSLLTPVAAAAADDVRATVLWYVEQERGIEPYRVRYIITQDYLRSDEGRDDGAYTLFDRALSQVYSVVPANRMVLQIDGSGDAPRAPDTLAASVQQTTDKEAPKIGGQAPLRLDLVAGAEVCHTALVAADLLPPVRQAIQEFQQALAVHQVRTLANTPVEYRTPCFLARYVYSSDFHWSRGLVLADWNAGGERRELVDYDVDVPMPAALFEVPEEYATMPAAGGR